jgi:DNA topoisomerase-1
MHLSAANPVTSARIAGLRYVTDQLPGVRRIGGKRTFRYIAPNGRTIRSAATLARIRTLAIPPAWRDVWICPFKEGHLQAVGRDARGRKQYRYHSQWRLVRDVVKFERMADFGKALPKIRAQLKRDLARSGLPKEKVLATIVWLLERTLIRVGNEEYTRHNNSFGLTTLRNHHVDIAGATVHFYFRGKSGIRHRISIEDLHLAKIVRRIKDLPGYELFQYVDENGKPGSIGSTDVNEYLRNITGQDFTAKDFRTWAGTILMVDSLSSATPVTSARQSKKNIVSAVEFVAKRLGNTVSVCRKCYVHPAVIETYMNKALVNPHRKPSLMTQEKALIRLLKHWKRESRPTSLGHALKESVNRRNKKVRFQ